MEKLRDRSTHLIRFGVVGVLNTGITFLLYIGFILAGIPYNAALITTAIIGILFSSFANKTFTFNGVEAGYLAAFIGVYVFTVGLNIWLIGLLIAQNFSPITAQGILVLPLAALTFVLLSVVNQYFQNRSTQEGP